MKLIFSLCQLKVYNAEKRAKRAYPLSYPYPGPFLSFTGLVARRRTENLQLYSEDHPFPAFFRFSDRAAGGSPFPFVNLKKAILPGAILGEDLEPFPKGSVIFKKFTPRGSAQKTEKSRRSAWTPQDIDYTFDKC